MSEKNQFVTEFRAQVTTLAGTIASMSELVDTYFDRGYGSGGGDEIVDADISSTGLTASEVASLITLGQQLKNFRDNAAVTQGDYGSTINKSRTDI